MKVAVICDFVEEQWPSMDLVANMLITNLERFQHVKAARVCPAMKFRCSRIPVAGGFSQARNADRLVNRFFDYPKAVKSLRDFDVFHIVDHSYSQLVHSLPPERVVVTCHDLDTFRSVLSPTEERRSFMFRSMTRRILKGFQKAARIACDSGATRDALLAHDVVLPDRLELVPLGVHPVCSPQPDREADLEASRLIGVSNPAALDILHVGSTVARKRIGTVLRVFAGVRARYPNARLIRVGGAFTAQQLDLVRELKLTNCVLILPYVSPEVLAALYRRAALVLQPSEREGFGLPVGEAMACGTSVIASDLSVLREIGGPAATYCDPDNIEAWIDIALRLLAERTTEPAKWANRREGNLRQAARFTWEQYAIRMSTIYQKLAA